MIPKTLLFLIVLLNFAATAFAQEEKEGDEEVGYYLTYRDFTSENLVKMDEYHGWSHSMGSVTLTFKKNGKKEKKKCKEIWGFVYKGALFRCDQSLGQFARVISVGKIVYYENGAAHISMLKNNTESGEYSLGYYGYLSNDLKSTMTPLPSGLSDATKKFKTFKASNKQHKVLYDCMDSKGQSYELTRECILEYNKDEEAEEEEE